MKPNAAARAASPMPRIVEPLAVREVASAMAEIRKEFASIGAEIARLRDGERVETRPEAKPPASVEEKLEAEDYNGFPVPESATAKRYSGSKFRGEINAQIPASFDAVLTFYRAELGKLNWKQDGNAETRPDRTIIAYATPQGPATLTLGKRNGETAVTLALRRTTEAQKAGILPRPGTTKIIMGSFAERDAVIKINNRAITVGAGIGKDAPNGPALELPPGRYRYTLKIAGRPATSEGLDVRADQTWALMIGPGGAIALNLY